MIGRTTVVLGSNSFAGAHMVDLLLRETATRVVGVSRSPEKSPIFLPYQGHENGRFAFHQIDLARSPAEAVKLLDAERPEVVMNFAALVEVAPSNDHPADYFVTNCTALADLTHALRQRDYLRHFLQVSTPEVYGSCPEPLREDAPMDPSTPYAASKGGADLLLRALFKTFGFPVSFIRATNYYGRHQQLFKIMPRTVIRVKEGRRIDLHGGGRAVKTWIHVRDAVWGMLAAVERGRAGEVYHLADANTVSVADVVRRICALMGREFDECTRVVDERVGQDARYVLDAGKASAELGWAPRVPFEEGVRDVVDWIEGSWDAVRDQPHEYVHLTPR